MKKTVLMFNKNGKINEILKDDFFIIKGHNNLLEIVSKEDYQTYFTFMHQCNTNNNAINMSIDLLINRRSSAFILNAFTIGEENLILILTRNIIKNQNIIKDIIETHGFQIKKIFNQESNNNYDELGQVNDKLLKIQRAFSKTNFELKNLNIQLESIIESIQEYLVLVDLEGEIIVSNSNYRDFFKKENNVFSFIKNNNEYLYRKITEIEDNDGYLYLNDIKLKSYMKRYFDVKVLPIFDDQDEKKYFVITFDDVTKRMKNIRKLRNLKMAFDQSKENIAITDTNHQIIFVNQSFVSAYGFDEEEELLHMNIKELIEKNEKPNENKLVDRKIYYNQRRNGELFPVEISKSSVELGKEIISYIYFVKNITGQLRYEEKLIILAKKDQMTGTYTREAGIAYLKEFLRDEKTEVSVLFLDINALKTVNDNYGHQMGDELIKEITDAMNESTRTNDVIARLGGDEFLVILPDSDRANAENIKKRIITDTKDRNLKKEYLVSVSIGIASSNEIEEANVDELINLADRRMYAEKKKYYEEKESHPRWY